MFMEKKLQFEADKDYQPQTLGYEVNKLDAQKMLIEAFRDGEFNMQQVVAYAAQICDSQAELDLFINNLEV